MLMLTHGRLITQYKIGPRAVDGVPPLPLHRHPRHRPRSPPRARLHVNSVNKTRNPLSFCPLFFRGVTSAAGAFFALLVLYCPVFLPRSWGDCEGRGGGGGMNLVLWIMRYTRRWRADGGAAVCIGTRRRRSRGREKRVYVDRVKSAQEANGRRKKKKTRKRERANAASSRTGPCIT